MRVVLMAGAYPPQKDGAEDYTVRLAEALNQVGIEVNIIAGGQWSAVRAPALVRKISKLRPHLVHIQYPTGGYGSSLTPQALSTFMPKVPVLTTMHEFSESHFLRKVADLPFAVRSRALVFTNEHERRHFSSWFPWVAKKSWIIPIGSNIPLSPGSAERDPLRVIHFGLIRPDKGLEDFLELARLAKAAERPYRFTIVGDLAPRYGTYPEELKESAECLPVEWKHGLSAEEVSQYLASSRFAYVPFPDGASGRRTSLLAPLGNGDVVITTRGSQTPNELEEVVRFTESPSQALTLLDELTSDVDQADALSSRASEYARRFSYTSIAEAHLRLYQRILHGEFQ